MCEFLIRTFQVKFMCSHFTKFGISPFSVDLQLAFVLFKNSHSGVLAGFDSDWLDLLGFWSLSASSSFELCLCLWPLCVSELWDSPVVPLFRVIFGIRTLAVIYYFFAWQPVLRDSLKTNLLSQLQFIVSAFGFGSWSHQPWHNHSICLVSSVWTLIRYGRIIAIGWWEMTWMHGLHEAHSRCSLHYEIRALSLSLNGFTLWSRKHFHLRCFLSFSLSLVSINILSLSLCQHSLLLA